MSPLRIEPLSDQHDRTGFTCGVGALDRYLATQAGQDVRRRVAACFVLVEGDAPGVLGFHTLAATSIALSGLPDAIAKRLPRHPVLSATLLGRLAVGSAWRGRGYGATLLLDAMGRALRSEIATFAFVVDAKDDMAERFYQSFGFLPLGDAGMRRLFLPMAEVAKVFR